MGRPYSYVNAPDRRPLEVYFNRVPQGPLTNRLARLEPGESLWVMRKPSGFFTVDEVPDAKDLWLLATGTALGVYLSILRTPEPWGRFHHIALVHSVRTRDELTYGDEIQELLRHHGERFRLVQLTSRDPHAATLSGRIPEALRDGRLEQQAGLELSPDLSHVMLCGNMGMIRDTTEVLEERGLRRHRRAQPGHYSLEKYH